MKHLPYKSPEVTVCVTLCPDVIRTSVGSDPALPDEHWDLVIFD